MTENVFAGLLTRFMKPIHIELPNEAINVPMPEIIREDYLFKLLNIFDEELLPIG